MGVTLDKHESRAGQSEALNQLRLEGDVGIGCAAEFKGLLEQALGSGCAVRILLEGATDLDVTAVQLLWAAGRKAKGSGVEYSIVSVAPEPILDALSEAGLQQFISPVNVL
jgi:anti-anti-sigma regulatory factor